MYWWQVGMSIAANKLCQSHNRACLMHVVACQDMLCKAEHVFPVQEGHLLPQLQHANYLVPVLVDALNQSCHAGKRPITEDSIHPQAKRPRFSVPDLSAYGRSTSDPPMSLQRRTANAANMSINVLDGRLVLPPQSAERRHLKSFNSGPAR